MSTRIGLGLSLFSIIASYFESGHVTDTIDPFTLSSTVATRITASATPTIGAFTLASSVTAKVTATLNSTISAFTLVAGDSTRITASATPTIDAFTLSATVTVTDPPIDPATLALTGWWKTDFAASPWVSSASAGTSGSTSDRNMTNVSHPPTVGSAINGHDPAHCGASNSNLATISNTSDFVTNSAWSISGVIKNVSAGAGSHYLSSQPWADTSVFGLSNGDLGIARAVDGGSVDVLVAYQHGSGYQSAPQAMPTSGAHYFHAWYDGVNINLSVDGAAPSQVASSASIGASTMCMGLATFAAGSMIGDIAEIMISDIDLGSTARTGLTAYFRARYGL